MKSATNLSYIRKYSQIAGYQDSRTITYSAYTEFNYVCLLLEQIDEAGINTKCCICPYISLDEAEFLLLYAYENGIGPDCLTELLDDRNIKYSGSEMIA